MSTSNKNNLHYVHCAIFFVLLFIFRLVPPIGLMSETGMQVLSVFIGLIYGWIFLGFAWPSLFGLLALGMTDYYGGVTAAVCDGFSQSMVWQVFFMLLFAGILKQLGLTEFIGNWLLSRKFCQGRPWVLTVMIFIACVLCGGLITMFASIFMIWAVFYDIAKTCGFKKGDKYIGFTSVGVVFFVVVSSLVFPFRPFPYMVLGLIKGTGVTEMPMMSWLIVGLVTIGSMIAVWILIGKFILRIDLSPMKSVDLSDILKSQKMNADQKIGMAMLVIMSLVLLLPSICPTSWPIIALFKKWDLVGIAVILICAAFLLRKKDGTALSDMQRLGKEINWDLVFMFAVTLPLGTALESNDVGVIATVMSVLVPIFDGVSPIVFMVGSLLLFGVLTQVTHNLVLMMVFTPVLAGLCVNYGIPPLLYAFCLAVILQCAFMTPAASAPAAVIFSNTEWITSKQAYSYTAMIVLAAFVVICCVMIPVGLLLF